MLLKIYVKSLLIVRTLMMLINNKSFQTHIATYKHTMHSCTHRRKYIHTYISSYIRIKQWCRSRFAFSFASINKRFQCIFEDCIRWQEKRSSVGHKLKKSIRNEIQTTEELCVATHTAGI
ncbi:unnamed protein product [Ceratitis capitata]|uniref:(Mediterranean fruit fly) hypothetical protein n=1 Tax=Ceratitis capitata TaxID=7213 RepID=A0A811V8B6_CERCA|nr:unnamed protein product [Ceratitis capitata]